MKSDLRINADRLHQRLGELAQIGAIDGGGVARLALTDADKAGRDQVVRWMKDLGLEVTIDAIGNIIGLRKGREDIAPVMTGSHIDTVRTGGRYDGNLGVLAGLEVCARLNDINHVTRRPFAVAVFTNEEGARFHPDCLGSLVYAGGMSLADALAEKAIDGAILGDELSRIGYAGAAQPGWLKPHAFLELHIEQGPILEAENLIIGAVEGVQGISWTEVTIQGVSNHAGTTPMHMRRDAGYAAAAISVFVRQLVSEMGGNQKGTVGRVEQFPNLVNVVASRAVITVDLRNTDEALLQQAEARFHAHLRELAQQERVEITTRPLARFEPVDFAPHMIGMVERLAGEFKLPCKRMPSGAGHDAQMMARLCDTGMIFVPSVNGLSHNVKEFTKPEDIAAGANILLQMVMELAD